MISASSSMMLFSPGGGDDHAALAPMMMGPALASILALGCTPVPPPAGLSMGTMGSQDGEGFNENLK